MCVQQSAILVRSSGLDCVIKMESKRRWRDIDKLEGNLHLLERYRYDGAIATGACRRGAPGRCEESPKRGELLRLHT